MIKLDSLLTRQVVWDSFLYCVRGGFWQKKAHLPASNHAIPDDFFGVGVAPHTDARANAFMLQQLQSLGIKNLRLDFACPQNTPDLTVLNCQFCQQLLDAGFQVTLRLIPHFDLLQGMQRAENQLIWREFIRQVIAQFGAQIFAIEIGNTINRRRWSGFNQNNFYAVWQIAFETISPHNIQLIGPNVQDFEPLYNISLLKQLQQKKQSPQVHTVHLFAERVREPELADHRIFKYGWTRIFNYNTIKKAKLLQKIGRTFGVSTTRSTGAFWALYRIARYFAAIEALQANYLVRYFVQLAASNALDQAFWATFICQREGLIDNGIADEDYPALERIAHYAQTDGALENFRLRPSFTALKILNTHLADARYVRAIACGQQLNIHEIEKNGQLTHIAWCANGKLAYLSQIYSATSLAEANIETRDGALNQQQFISESPIYLHWPSSAPPKLLGKPTLAKGVSVFWHTPNKAYFTFEQDGWRGLILAKNQAEADLLVHTLHPTQLQAPEKSGALRHARNAIWAINDPRDAGKQLTVKKPVKMYPHKQWLDQLKPSKALRSWSGAFELLRRDIDSAQPVAYFEQIGDKTLKQNFFICDFVKADSNIGEIFRAFTAGETRFLGLNKQQIFEQFAYFCAVMHGRGIYFRDFSGGNILVNKQADDTLKFTLIDTARLRTAAHFIPYSNRIADMCRACHKLDWANRKELMSLYMAFFNREFSWRYRWPFYVYDAKVWLKRTIGRKGINKLKKRLFSN